MPRKWTWLLATASLLSAFFTPTHAEECPAKTNQNLFYHVSLNDQDSHNKALSEFRDTTVLVNCISTSCPAVCSKQNQQIFSVQQPIPPTYRDAMRFLSVAVGPKHNSTKTLKAYAKARGVDFSNGSFVTGDQKAIAAFSQFKAVFDPPIKKPQPYDHTTQLYMFARQGKLMQRFNGLSVDKTRIAKEMQMLNDLQQAPQRSTTHQQVLSTEL